MLYSSKSNIKLSALDNYTVPERENTSYWAGVKHQDIILGVEREARSRGMLVTDRQIQTSRCGHHLYVSWDFDRQVPGVKGLNMAMGYRGSNMGKFAHTFLVGARVFICANGMISSDFTLKKKHSKNLKLKELINTAYDRYMHESTLIRDKVVELRNRVLTDPEAHEIMFGAAREGAIAWSRLRILDELWRNPLHRQFERKDGWSLYNAFTESAKITVPVQQIEIMKNVPAIILN